MCLPPPAQTNIGGIPTNVEPLPPAWLAGSSGALRLRQRGTDPQAVAPGAGTLSIIGDADILPQGLDTTPSCTEDATATIAETVAGNAEVVVASPDAVKPRMLSKLLWGLAAVGDSARAVTYCTADGIAVGVVTGVATSWKVPGGIEGALGEDAPVLTDPFRTAVAAAFAERAALPPRLFRGSRNMAAFASRP